MCNPEWHGVNFSAVFDIKIRDLVEIDSRRLIWSRASVHVCPEWPVLSILCKQPLLVGLSRFTIMRVEMNKAKICPLHGWNQATLKHSYLCVVLNWKYFCNRLNVRPVSSNWNAIFAFIWNLPDRDAVSSTDVSGLLIISFLDIVSGGLPLDLFI